MNIEHSKYNADNLLKNRELIIKSAKKLFLENGLNAVSMNDIVKVSGFARKTLYRHFDNKENLAFEVLKSVYQDLVNTHTQLYRKKEFQTGYEELNFKLHSFMEMLLLHLQEVTYLVEYDHYIKSDYEHDTYLSKVILIQDSVERGQKDRSIKFDPEINKNLSFILCESCLGFVYRYSLRKQSGAKLRLQSNDLMHFVDLLMLSIKA